MRDRLIELLNKIKYTPFEDCNIEASFKNQFTEYAFNHIVDEILADGWMRPPCKVGDTFYGLNETEYDDYEVLGFKWGKRRGDDENVLILLTVYDMEFVWGEEAFLAREDAEAKLKEGVQG